MIIMVTTYKLIRVSHKAKMPPAGRCDCDVRWNLGLRLPLQYMSFELSFPPSPKILVISNLIFKSYLFVLQKSVAWWASVWTDESIHNITDIIHTEISLYISFTKPTRNYKHSSNLSSSSTSTIYISPFTKIWNIFQIMSCIHIPWSISNPGMDPN